MVLISDLRQELSMYYAEELQAIDIHALPDAMVVLLHDQLSTAEHPEAPMWLLSLITTWIALEKDTISEYQLRQEQQQALINELRARLGDSYTDYLDAS